MKSYLFLKFHVIDMHTDSFIKQKHNMHTILCFTLWNAWLLYLGSWGMVTSLGHCHPP